MKTRFTFKALTIFRKWHILENVVCQSTDSPSPQRSRLPASPQTPLACNRARLSHWRAEASSSRQADHRKLEGKQKERKPVSTLTRETRRTAFIKPVTTSLKIPKKP